MELTYATIVVLAAMVFMLAGMVGYLYWQQTGILRHLQGLANLIATKITPPQVTFIQAEAEAEAEESEEDDDRVSVKEEVEKVEGPPVEEEHKEEEHVDVDDLQDKTAAQLRDMLTAKGIPFGKRDAKTVLIQLLKATS